MSTKETDPVFDAIETGDLEVFSALFAEGTALRRNTEDEDVPMEVMAQQLGGLHAVAKRLTYSDRNTFPTPDGFITHQILEVEFPNGNVVRMPTVVRFYLDDDGRIRRMEEWCDSAHERAIEHEVMAVVGGET
jgi:ketosteroid isomerase-like protein